MKKSLGGNLLNLSQLKNQHKKLNCRNSEVHNLKQKLVHHTMTSDDEEKNEDQNISFYLKLGKCKKFKYI